MAAEAEGEDIEEKYVTACFVLMYEFGYDIEQMSKMPATTFEILLDELRKKSEREKEASKEKSFR